MFAAAFASPRNVAASYRSVGIDTAIAGADPHRLVTMLFDGALERIASARAALTRGDVAARGVAIGRAIAIVQEGLHGALRPRDELGRNLDALYDYIVRRLLQANAKGSDGLLAESAALLATLRDGWVQIAPGAQSRSAGTRSPAVAAA